MSAVWIAWMPALNHAELSCLLEVIGCIWVDPKRQVGRDTA